MNVFGNAAKTLGLGAMLWLGLAAQSALAQSVPTGTWTGTYSGSDNGTVTITINSTEAVTCDFKSSSGADHQMTGGVTSAAGINFTCSSPTSSTTSFWTASGYSLDGGTTLTGDWASENYTAGTMGQGNFTATLGGSGGGGGGGRYHPHLADHGPAGDQRRMV